MIKFGMFIDIRATIAVFLCIGISILVYYKVQNRKERLILIANFAQILSLIVSLVYITFVLGTLDDASKIGISLGNFINTNLYASLFSLGVRIYNRIN